MVLCGQSEEELRAIVGHFVVCKRKGLKINASKGGRKDWSVRFVWMDCYCSIFLSFLFFLALLPYICHLFHGMMHADHALVGCGIKNKYLFIKQQHFQSLRGQGV